MKTAGNAAKRIALPYAIAVIAPSPVSRLPAGRQWQDKVSANFRIIPTVKMVGLRELGSGDAILARNCFQGVSLLHLYRPPRDPLCGRHFGNAFFRSEE